MTFFVSFMNRWSSQCCFMVQICGDYLNRKKKIRCRIKYGTPKLSDGKE